MDERVIHAALYLLLTTFPRDPHGASRAWCFAIQSTSEHYCFRIPGAGDGDDTLDAWAEMDCQTHRDERADDAPDPCLPEY